MEKGLIVKSKAGRDKGKLFVVLDVKDNYVWIADGKIRKMTRPKKKKLIHIELVEPMQKCSGESMTSDKGIRRVIAEYQG